MSVQAVFPVLQRPWRGYADPGLPVGMWIAQGTVLGDASGTNQGVVFVFKEEGEPLGGRFYNLEQMEVHSTLASLSFAALVLENFDIISTTGLVNREYHLRLTSDGITTSSLQEYQSAVLPIFMGRPSLVGLQTQLRVRVANTLNETLFFTGQGYIWEPRSLLVDGGLRRPIDGLYG